MEKHYGKCALCGKECALTFEHIPPRGAFNSRPARPVSGEELLRLNDKARMPWDTSGLRYDNQQQGMGRYSLCEDCNNKTGHWYGDPYVKFTYAVHDAMKNLDPNNPPTAIEFEGVYPLRFIKQVLSMFCSLLSPDNPEIEDLRKFVLDRDATGIDKSKYKLCLYFTNTTLMKHSGLTVVLKEVSSKIEPMAMSELIAYPLGFILYFDPTETWNYQGTDITECADYHYDEKINMIFPWIVKEVNDMYPETFRSRDEIRATREKNQK